MPDLINEEFAARHFLSAVGISAASLKQRDKPDFVMLDADQTIGLEVCNASPEEYQRATKVLHHRQHSIRINAKWRVSFRWEAGNAHQVEITDYH